MASPATSALCSRLDPRAALRQAEAKFRHCTAVGRANGLTLISVVVFSALSTASAGGSSETNSASPISPRAKALAPRPSIMRSLSAAALQAKIDGGGAEAEQAHDAGDGRGLADIGFEEGMAIGERRQHLAAIGR